MKRMIAISIRQPFVEQIMLRTKKFEYRSVPTRIRGRVYVYASQRPRPPKDWKRMKVGPDAVPLGKIVGTVEVVGCERRGPEYYAYRLRAPRRLRRPIVPTHHPQPRWFWPFGK